MKSLFFLDEKGNIKDEAQGRWIVSNIIPDNSVASQNRSYNITRKGSSLIVSITQIRPDNKVVEIENPNPDALVFITSTGTPQSRRNLLNRQLKPTCNDLGFKSMNWHWLRHVNATLLDSVGTPLGTTSALLGHSSPEITREIYVHSVPADAREAVEKVEKLIGPNRTQVPVFGRLVSTLTH